LRHSSFPLAVELAPAALGRGANPSSKPEEGTREKSGLKSEEEKSRYSSFPLVVGGNPSSG